MDQIGFQIAAFILQFATNHPYILTILMVIGSLRAILKPLFALARAYTQSTETKADDELVDKVEQSKAYKALVFVLDWFASVKLIK